jgi:hypothetical protein
MKYLLFLFITFLSISSYGQRGKKINISVKTDSVIFTLNGIIMYTPYPLKEGDPTWIYIARKKGYVNEGFTFSELAKKGVSSYAVELEKISPLPAGYSSKMIEVYKLTDKTGRLDHIDISDPFFITALSDKLIAYGYKNVANADPFDTKQEKAQLKIAGEIRESCRNTIGSGFQISIIVNWSVYDVYKDKVVFEWSSTGYSDTQSTLKMEMSLALKNALEGLMSNSDFQKLAQDSGEEVTK